MSNTGADADPVYTFMKNYTLRMRNSVKIPKNMMERLMHGNSNRDYVTHSCGVRPGMLWGVDLQGRKLTRFWQNFAEDNSFQYGDLLLFKYFGSTRIHIERYRPRTGNTSDATAMGDAERFFTLSVTADTLDRSIMFLPRVFCEKNGLYDFAGDDIFLVAENEVEYAVKLNVETFPKVKRLRLTNGLREFLEDNDIKAKDEIKMELYWDETSIPTLKLVSKVIVV